MFNFVQSKTCVIIVTEIYIYEFKSSYKKNLTIVLQYLVYDNLDKLHAAKEINLF